MWNHPEQFHYSKTLFLIMAESHQENLLGLSQYYADLLDLTYSTGLKKYLPGIHIKLVWIRENILRR